MKKVGLFTCFMDNYGGCLQAYAMQKKIEDFGCKCEIVNYLEPRGYEKKMNIMRFIFKNKFICSFRAKIDKNYRITYLKQKKFDLFRKNNLKFGLTKYYTINELKDDFPVYDCYVCGSDQIWNPTIYNGNNLAYTLAFVPKEKRKVAYAPSIGVSEFPSEYVLEFKELVRRIDYVSVREETGVNIINELIPEKARLVLDPTLLLDSKEWSKIAIEKYDKGTYILVYIFSDRPELYDFVDYCANKCGLKIIFLCVVPSNMNKKYIQILDAGPEEFVGLIKNAKLVITDSFHATAFSINFNVPFYSLLRFTKDDKKSMNSRIFNILKLCQLENRLVDSFSDNFKIDYNIDFKMANQLLANKRTEDIEFFKKAIISD